MHGKTSAAQVCLKKCFFCFKLQLLFQTRAEQRGGLPLLLQVKKGLLISLNKTTLHSPYTCQDLTYIDRRSFTHYLTSDQSGH